MISSQLALVIVLQNFVVVILGGAAIGLVASALLRYPWNWRILIVDMCTAGATTLLLVLVTVLFNLSRYAIHDQTRILELAGISAPVARRIYIAALRNHGKERTPRTRTE